MTLSSSKCAERSRLRRTKTPRWSINTTALLFTALWQPCSLGRAQPVSPRALKQLSMTASLVALLWAACMGGYDKVGWHSASGAVQMLPNRTGFTVWVRVTLSFRKRLSLWTRELSPISHSSHKLCVKPFVHLTELMMPNEAAWKWLITRSPIITWAASFLHCSCQMVINCLVTDKWYES